MRNLKTLQSKGYKEIICPSEWSVNTIIKSGSETSSINTKIGFSSYDLSELLVELKDLMSFVNILFSEDILVFMSSNFFNGQFNIMLFFFLLLFEPWNRFESTSLLSATEASVLTIWNMWSVVKRMKYIYDIQYLYWLPAHAKTVCTETFN